jgi:uncharacterized membrane protein
MRFSQADEQRITEAIRQAELKTSGEIRIHVEDTNSKELVYDQAVMAFEKLNMHLTEARNGVLIYVAMKRRSFAIIGDIGIHEKVPPNFWDQIKDAMKNLFIEGKAADAIVLGITEAGIALATYFPYTHDDENELTNDISYD